MSTVLNFLFLVFILFFEFIICENSVYSYYKSHDEFVSMKWEHFIAIYDEIFILYRNQKDFRLLEIGVQNGGSLQIWSSYFGPGSDIVGVDVDEKVCTDLSFRKGITVHCLDIVAVDESTLNLLGQFDVIIVGICVFLCR